MFTKVSRLTDWQNYVLRSVIRLDWVGKANFIFQHLPVSNCWILGLRTLDQHIGLILAQSTHKNDTPETYFDDWDNLYHYTSDSRYDYIALFIKHLNELLTYFKKSLTHHSHKTRVFSYRILTPYINRSRIEASCKNRECGERSWGYIVIEKKTGNSAKVVRRLRFHCMKIFRARVPMIVSI